MFRHFYRVTQDIDKDTYNLKSEEIPKFIISVCGPYFPKMEVDYKGDKFK